MVILTFKEEDPGPRDTQSVLTQAIEIELFYVGMSVQKDVDAFADAMRRLRSKNGEF